MVSLKKRTIFCLHLRVVSPLLPARLQHSSAVLHSTALTSRGTRGICCLHAHKCQSQSRVQRSIIKCNTTCMLSNGPPMPMGVCGEQDADANSHTLLGKRRAKTANKCATSVQQVWYLLRGVIELAVFAKPTVARLDAKLTVWLSGPCAHHAQTHTLTRRAPHARASPEGDRRRQRGGRRETIRDRRKDSCRHPSPHPTGKSPRPRPSAD